VSGEYLKFTAYFGERLRSGGRFTSDALLDLCGDRAVATSVVLRGVAGFGPRHELRSDLTLSMSEDPPIAVAAVDRAEVITALAGEAADLVSRGLVTLERARLAQDTTSVPPSAKVTSPVQRTSVSLRAVSRALAMLAIFSGRSCDSCRASPAMSSQSRLAIPPQPESAGSPASKIKPRRILGPRNA